jgi:BNR repeat-like domain
MRRNPIRVLIGMLLISGLAAGCGSVPLTTGQAQATAVAGGCWPYGVIQPIPVTPPIPATPRIPPPVMPPTTMPDARVTPWTVSPTCTPAPLTPTVTPVPTRTPRPWVAPTPQPPAAISSAQELQDANGMVRERGIAWAYNPRSAGPVVAWIAYGSRADERSDGQVWVASRGPSGGWRDPQSVTTAVVEKNWGGLGLAAAPDGSLRLLYATGDPKPGMISTIYEVRSADDGVTWSLPQALTRGGVQALRADSRGDWHALIIGPTPFEDQLFSGVAFATGAWQWTPVPGARREYRADLAVLELGGHVTREILTVHQDSPDLPTPHAHLFGSEDGGAWIRATQVPPSAAAIRDPVIRPQILAVPRGNGLVVAAWSNYGRGTVVATISTDGGRTFGPTEVIAQQQPDGGIVPPVSYGTEPSLAYDPEADVLLASWVEVATREGQPSPFPTRSFVAWRPLDHPLGQPWIGAATPDTLDQPRPLLDPQRRAYLFATPDGAHAGLILIDERNFQWRVSVRDVHLPTLTSHAES